ncbi:MAG: cation diffusion facilitator family transporter [Thiovulaceae bacterium]|nr:cation diffusion facilitator family transporter [Sulfurimonadaceae bacterium]
MRIEQKATIISSGTAALLVTIKMAVGVMSGSVAILASAVDSFLDLLVSLFNYFALHHSEKRADKKFNFGRGKLEALAAVIEGTIISASAVFILYNAVMKLLHPEAIAYMNLSLIVMGVSILLTAALVLFLVKIAKRTGNIVIRADALHYETDLYTNGAILVSLAVIHYTDFGIIDPLLGVAITFYMIYSAYPIIKEGLLMLMDIALEDEEIRKIEHYLDGVDDINGYHRLSTRRSGSDIFISVHAVFNVSISLFDAHRVSDKIEEDLQKLFKDERVHSIIHMDPYDDSDVNLYAMDIEDEIR